MKFKLRKKGTGEIKIVEAEKKGKQWVALCPWHNDKNPSLSINKEGSFARNMKYEKVFR